MFPATSNLLSPHPGDAWIIADATIGNAHTRSLVSTNGPTLIVDVQRALASVMSEFARGEFPAAFRHVAVVDYFTRVPVRLTGRWDAATARAAMLLADPFMASSNGDTKAGWAEVYRRKFGPALTGFALTAWLNEATMSRRLREEIDSDKFTAIIPRGARLPLWGFAPSGDRAAISIRKL